MGRKSGGGDVGIAVSLSVKREGWTGGHTGHSQLLVATQVELTTLATGKNGYGLLMARSWHPIRRGQGKRMEQRAGGG